jgi:hypothetical protein
VAEGVEDESQLCALVGLGVPLIQGYYLGRPAAPWCSGEHCDQVRHWRHLRESPGHLVPFQRNPLAGELVLGDHGGVVAVRVPSADGDREVVPLLMDAATPVRDAVLRAMARSTPLERLAPMVLTDASGRATGVIEVERLVAELAGDEPDAGPDNGPDTGPAPRASNDDSP